MGQEAEWIWSLKAVERPRSLEKKVFDVRVFDNARAKIKQVEVKESFRRWGWPDSVRLGFQVRGSRSLLPLQVRRLHAATLLRGGACGDRLSQSDNA